MGEREPDLMGALSWHSAVGKRLHRAQGFIGCESTRPTIVALALVLEPLRFLQGWLLKRPRGVQDHFAWVGLCEMATTATSPAIAALQSLSSLLSGRHEQALGFALGRALWV